MEKSYFEQLVQDFIQLPEVESLALGGSRATGAADIQSDYDVYVYLNDSLATEKRLTILGRYCHAIELNNTYWEPEDDAILNDGITVELIYRDLSDFDRSLKSTLIDHMPGNSYSTCLWSNLLNTAILFDRTGQYRDLQQKYTLPYPEALRSAIIKRGRQLIQGHIPSYYGQIKKAVEREDWVSINHRTAELLASYFDVIFAVNRVPHPGEKRQLSQAVKLCNVLPANFEKGVENLIRTTGSDAGSVMAALDELITQLDVLLAKAG